MKRSKGPAKVLAPSLSPENICEHEFSVAEGLQLDVNCETCSGAQDLESKGCMICVMNAIARGAIPDAVILRRFMHKRYRGNAIDGVTRAAIELSALTRALRCVSAVSDRKCRTCPCSPARLVARLKSNLMEDPGRYIDDSSRTESVFAGAIAEAVCDRGLECASRARAFSAVIGGMD